MCNSTFQLQDIKMVKCYFLNIFCHSNILYFNRFFYTSMSHVVINVFCCTESLPENGQERPQHVIFLPQVIDHYSAAVGICMW